MPACPLQKVEERANEDEIKESDSDNYSLPCFPNNKPKHTDGFTKHVEELNSLPKLMMI